MVFLYNLCLEIRLLRKNENTICILKYDSDGALHWLLLFAGYCFFFSSSPCLANFSCIEVLSTFHGQGISGFFLPSIFRLKNHIPAKRNVSPLIQSPLWLLLFSFCLRRKNCFLRVYAWFPCSLLTIMLSVFVCIQNQGKGQKR